MVSFNFPTPGNTSSSTVDDEIKRQRYRVTPHPHATATLLERDGASINDNDPSMNDYISNVPSPDQQHDQGQTSNTSQYNDAEWNEWLANLPDRSNVPNLHAYLTAKITRDKAKKTFEIALEECLQRLTHAMTEEMLADTVGVIYQEQGARFEALESSLVDVIKSNHDRRIELNRALADADTVWGSLHKRLRTRLWNNTMTTSTNEDTAECSDDRILKSIPNASGNGTPNVATTDPNWEEIAESFEPAHRTVQSFLGSREKLRLADEALSQALDEIHDGLKADADAIVQVVVAFYDRFEDETVALEQDIEFHLMNNCERREAFQTSLQESAKQAQGLIANLMSRLTSGK